MYPAFNTARSLALFRHPPVTGAYGAVLLAPFEMNVWTSCAAMWLAVILTIRFVSWVESSTSDYMVTANEETVRSWSDCLMIIIGAISEQGVYLFYFVKADSHIECRAHAIPDHAVLLKATAQHDRRQTACGLLARIRLLPATMRGVPRSYQTHTNLRCRWPV